MRDFNSPRPDFDDPPVIEVVLSVQFEPLSLFATAQFGRLWEYYRDEFPKTEDKPALQQVIERFGVRPPSFSIELGIEPRPLRCWFKQKDETELIQVQQDRFVFNWKRGPSDVSYPRYEYVRDRFINLFNLFQSFLKENELGKVVPNQIEITYVNHLLPGHEWSRHGQFERIFSVWSGHYSEPWTEPEDTTFSCRYLITNKDDKPIGRLHVSAEPRIRLEDNAPIVNLELTARGAPEKEDLDGILSFLNLGREYIVRGFAAITTPEMHQLWRRNDGS